MARKAVKPPILGAQFSRLFLTILSCNHFPRAFIKSQFYQSINQQISNFSERKEKIIAKLVFKQLVYDQTHITTCRSFDVTPVIELFCIRVAAKLESTVLQEIVETLLNLNNILMFI